MRKNIVFANLPVAPFLKGPSTFPDFRMQTLYLSTGLFWFYLRIKTFTNFKDPFFFV